MLRAVTLLLILTTFACGYQMVGLSGGKTAKNNINSIYYYLNEIHNNSVDKTITSDMQTYITRFFSDYDSLRPKDNATYELTIALEEYSVTAATVSSSREAVTSNLTLAYSFNVKDKTGKNLYQRTISNSQTFSSGDDTVTDYDSMQAETFASVTDDILSEFKNDFEFNKR